MKNITVAQLLARIESDKKAIENSLANWKKKFETNPIYALENSDICFVYAARLEIAIRLTDLIAYYQQDGSLDEDGIMFQVRDEVIEGLQWRASTLNNASTSHGTNAMNAARTQVYAEYHKLLN